MLTSMIARHNRSPCSQWKLIADDRSKGKIKINLCISNFSFDFDADKKGNYVDRIADAFFSFDWLFVWLMAVSAGDHVGTTVLISCINNTIASQIISFGSNSIGQRWTLK